MTVLTIWFDVRAGVIVLAVIVVVVLAAIVDAQVRVVQVVLVDVIAVEALAAIVSARIQTVIQVTMILALRVDITDIVKHHAIKNLQ